jgi:hypothetical protein
LSDGQLTTKNTNEHERIEWGQIGFVDLFVAVRVFRGSHIRFKPISIEKGDDKKSGRE